MVLDAAALELYERTSEEDKITVSTALPLSVATAVDELAKKQRVSRMALIRDAVLEYVARRSENEPV